MITLQEIQHKALELGWDDVGITSAEIPQEDIDAYESWLNEGHQADMHYMNNRMRCFPQEFFPGAKTAIIFISYYKQEKRDFQKNIGLIASYARGKDYHNVHRKRLKKFITWLEEKAGQKGIAKGFTDSAPVLEKALAVKAGLGWFGKNTLLIHRKFGTFILLSGLFTTLSFPDVVKEMRLPRCGSCTRCLDACPTGALISPYHLDASRCLSYHLIESKQEIPEEIQKKNPGYLFGCDICQDVCPHNSRKPVATTPEFSSENGMGPYLDREGLQTLAEHPEKIYGSPVKRSGVQRMLSVLNQLRLTSKEEIT